MSRRPPSRELPDERPIMEAFERDVILLSCTRIIGKGVVHMVYKRGPDLIDDAIMSEEVFDLLHEHYGIKDGFYVLRIKGYEVRCPQASESTKPARFITSFQKLDPKQALQFNT